MSHGEIDPMDYRLRPVGEEDEAFLYRLPVSTMEPMVAQIWGRDEAFQAASFRRHVDPSRQRIVVVDGRDVGVLAVERRPDSFFLGTIEISPEEQGRGLGTAIVHDVLAEAFARGLPVALQVNRVNPARGLYERLGFVETGRAGTHVLMAASPPIGDRPAVPRPACPC